MGDSHESRGGQGTHGGTKTRMASPSQDLLVPFLLLFMRDEGSYDNRLKERLDELGFDGTGPEEMYRTLWKMEREGMLVCDREGFGFKIPRWWYEITETGRACLESQVSSLGRRQEDIDLFLTYANEVGQGEHPDEREATPGAFRGSATHRRRHLESAIEEGKEVEDEHGRRRGREDYEELDRLLVEADRSLEREDLRGANEALKKAGVKATSMWGKTDRAQLPGHTRMLVGLLWEVQEDILLGYPGRNTPSALRKDLRQLRSRFALEARRDANKTAAGGRSSRREEEAGRTEPPRRETR